jgi:hypothetical protein
MAIGSSKDAYAALLLFFVYLTSSIFAGRGNNDNGNVCIRVALFFPVHMKGFFRAFINYIKKKLVCTCSNVWVAANAGDILLMTALRLL